nr:dTMP kinase [Candidatus Schneideria nysicola]
MSNYSELLLFYAARIQLIEKVIKPAIEKGSWILSDRYELSSQAYQGGGRKIHPTLIKILSKLILENCQPDLILYLDVPPLIGLSRIRSIRELDRIESESMDFFERVRLCYKYLAKKDSRIFVINANQPKILVESAIYEKMEKWLKFNS